MAKRILVVEDEADDRKIFATTLVGLGYEVFEARDGAEALNCVRVVRPNLILMDLAMYPLDGYEATRQLKNDPETSSIPVVVLTCFGLRGDEERARAVGCDEYILKPLLPGKLREIVHRFLGPARDEAK